MSSLSDNRIMSVYKSRMNLLDMLEQYGYDVSDYVNFSTNEIDAMFSEQQLDMLMSNKNGTKCYVKYFVSNQTQTKTMRVQALDEIIEDLYYTEAVLKKQDTLIVVIDNDPNDTMKERIQYLFDRDEIYVNMFNIKRLQFNVLKHEKQPKAFILTEEETKAFMKEHNVKKLAELPEISRFDPLAMAICLRPKQIVKLHRKSPTALLSVYYRVCK